MSYRVHIYEFHHRWETHEPRGKWLLQVKRMHGGGGNYHYKGIIYRRGAGMGYTFQASKYINEYHFLFKSISMGYLFHSKSIWMGTIFAIGSIWMGMFLTSPSIWMGWGPGTENHGKLPPPFRERMHPPVQNLIIVANIIFLVIILCNSLHCISDIFSYIIRTS